ncbi:MAG: hypothetical protein LHV69_01075 [Elusimicrobia bacterium]|nr:hypothetical protein [Candidatus Obscuribacterium magneticum]
MEKLDFTQLDQLFDEALERLDPAHAAPIAISPEGPLSADHFLLKKSWDYFRQRLRLIEEQNQTLLQSKEAEGKALQDEIQELKGHLEKMEEENVYLRAFEDSVKEERTEDHLTFKKSAEGLRLAWEEERNTLENSLAELDLALDESKKKEAAEITRFHAIEDELRRHSDTLKEELTHIVENKAELEKKHALDLSEKDEMIQSLQSKIDLMRGEIERRDQLLREGDMKRMAQDKQLQELLEKVTARKTLLEQKFTELDNLNTRYEILEREKEAIRSAWEKEQAQWRELWERDRQTWEKQGRQIKGLEEELLHLSPNTKDA